MTPFGIRLRALREERGITAKEMAAGLGVSPAYLSALEHGKRGRPNKRFVHRVCQYLGIIWDDAEALQEIAGLSHPRVVVDTGWPPRRPSWPTAWPGRSPTCRKKRSRTCWRGWRRRAGVA